MLEPYTEDRFTMQDLERKHRELVVSLLPKIKNNPARFGGRWLETACLLDPSLLQPRDFVVLSPSNKVLCGLRTNAIGARETQVYTGCNVVPAFQPKEQRE